VYKKANALADRTHVKGKEIGRRTLSRVATLDALLCLITVVWMFRQCCYCGVAVQTVLLLWCGCSDSAATVVWLFRQCCYYGVAGQTVLLLWCGSSDSAITQSASRDRQGISQRVCVHVY
jgi:hypothetical protein